MYKLGNSVVYILSVYLIFFTLYYIKQTYNKHNTTVNYIKDQHYTHCTFYSQLLM